MRMCASCTPRPVALLMIFYGVNFPADAVGLSDGIVLISCLIGFNFAIVAFSPACVSRHSRSKKKPFTKCSFHKYAIATDRPVDVVVLVEASAQNVNSRVTLASASTLSGSVVRTLSV